MTNIEGILVPGQSFKLFDAGTYPAFGSVILPTLVAPLTWNNTLSVDGTIAVVSPPQPQPEITGIVTEGNTTIISGNSGIGGSSGGPYFVLASTNLTLSLTNWTPLSTNLFVGGNFSVTNVVATNEPVLFYLLQVPQ